jgi:hypothetical protein
MNHQYIPFPVFLVLAIAVLIAAAMGDRRRQNQRNPEIQRRDGLAALARKLNLRFSPQNDFQLAERLSFLSWLSRGDVRFAYNASHGHHEGFPIFIFDYRFSIGRYDYYWSAYILKMNTNFPDTLITRENFESRLLESIGQSHVTFESADFSQAYSVRAADKKFAFDVCNPKMIDYLLANRDLIIEIRNGAILLLFEDWLRPEKVETNLSRLIEIRKLLPQYLFITP